MEIEVRLFATFREGRFKSRKIDLPGGSNVGDLLKKLNISKEETGILLLNGRHSKEDAKLNDDDTVAIFPAVGGG